MTALRWTTAVRRWRSVLVLAVLGALLGLAVGAVVGASWPRSYVAHARVMMATPEWNDSTATAGGDGDQTATTYGDQFTQQRMPTYQELVGAARVLNPAASDVGLTPEQLGAQISSRLVPDTVLLEVTARDADPQRAADEANAVARRLVEVIADLERSTPNAVSPIQPVLVNGATAAARASSPHLVAVFASGAALGLVAALTVEVVRRRGRTGVVFGDDGPQLGGLPVFGVLGLDDDADAECRARLVNELARAAADPVAGVLALIPVDSAVDARTAAHALAAALAGTGRRVCVIVDGQDREREERALAPGTVTEHGAGPEAARNASYYGSETFRRHLRDAAHTYDDVLVCTRPVGSGASALDVGRAASATVLLSTPHCRTAELTAAQTDLAHCGIEPLGVLVVDQAGHDGAGQDGAGQDGAGNDTAGPARAHRKDRDARPLEERKVQWN